LRRAGFARGVEEAFQHAALWQSYLTSGSTVHYSILPEVWDWRETLFPGFIAIGFGVLGIGWTLWRRARIGSLTAKPDGMAETVGYYSLVAVGSLWVSLGPQGGLYQWLYDAVPLFHFLRAPGRFGFGVTLSLSVIAALTLARGLAGHRRRRLYLAAVAILAIGELTTEIPFQPAPVPDAAVVALSRLPRGPVVELPFWQSGRSLTRHTEYMYRSIHHWHPLVNGYSDYFPPGFFDVGGRLESFPSPEAFEAMDANAVRYIVVHLTYYSDHDRAALLTDPHVRERLTMLVRTNAVVLYEVRSPGRIVP
jgi:hypothetical protein